MTAPATDLALLRSRLVAVEAAYADALGDALPLIRGADPEARKAALEALRLTPERCLAAVEAVEEHGQEIEEGGEA